MNTLPLQGEVDEFLRDFFPKHKDESFYLTALTSIVIEHFGVTAEDAALKYNHSHGQTSGETTRIEQLANWGCVHLLLSNHAKRTGPNEYQDIHGPKPIYTIHHLSRKLVSEARVSVRILKNLSNPKWQDPTTIFMELTGHTFSDDVIEAAINREFATKTT